MNLQKWKSVCEKYSFDIFSDNKIGKENIEADK